MPKPITHSVAQAITAQVIQELQAKLDSIKLLDVPHDNKAIRREITIERALLDMVGAIAGAELERECAGVLGYTEFNTPYMPWGEALRERVEASTPVRKPAPACKACHGKRTVRQAYSMERLPCSACSVSASGAKAPQKEAAHA